MGVLDIRFVTNEPVTAIRWCANSEMNIGLSKKYIKIPVSILAECDVEDFINALRAAQEAQKVLTE